MRMLDGSVHYDVGGHKKDDGEGGDGGKMARMRLRWQWWASKRIERRRDDEHPSILDEELTDRWSVSENVFGMEMRSDEVVHPA